MRPFLSSLCTSFVLFPSKLALFKPLPSLSLCEIETPVQASQDLVIGKITSFGNRQSRCVPTTHRDKFLVKHQNTFPPEPIQISVLAPHPGVETRAAAFWQHTDFPEEMAGICQTI